MAEIENPTSIVLPGDYIPRKYGIRWLPLQHAFLLLFILGALGFVFSAQGLPDYDSYKRIYETVSGYYFWGWEPFYVFLNYLGKYFQLSYDKFRLAILFLSLTCFAAAMHIFSKNLRWVESRYQKQSGFSKILEELIFIFAFTVFFFEFFVIRIRAGLAISMALLAFSLFWPGNRQSSKFRFMLILILLALAFASHASSTVILVYLLFYPCVLSLFYTKDSFSRYEYLFKILLFYAVLMPAFLMVYAIIILSVYRGSHMFSELNIFRLIALSVIPLMIAILGMFRKGFIGLRSISKTQVSSPNNVLVHRIACQLMTWHFFTTFSYISMGFALLLFYPTGIIDRSGEAIVRLFTLSSPLAVFVILCSTGFYKCFWLFLLLSNSLFFVNTVFLSI